MIYSKDRHKAMNKLWFKRKTYGWGWTPVSWEGWVTTLAFVIFEYWNFWRLDSVADFTSDTVRPFVIQTFLSVLVLLSICYYTGESPRWQWPGTTDRGRSANVRAGEPKKKKS
jgi:hypothetical protein